MQCCLALCLVAGGAARGQEWRLAPNSSPPSRRDVNVETLMKISAPFTVAAVGDLIMPQPLYSDDPRFEQLIGRIHQADVGFANMESSLIDFRHFPGPVAGTEAPLETGAAIKAMGITIMSRANNHTFDGGVAGMISTDEALDRLGIAHAGTGMNLQQARAAAFQETPKGRVGVVSMFSVDDTSTYGPHYDLGLATYRNGDLGGRPGENPLHLTTYHAVSAADLQRLKSIAAAAYGTPGGSNAPLRDAAPQRLRFFDKWYEAGPEPGTLHYEMNPQDERDILDSVRNGKVYADFMIVTIHAHQAPHVRSQGLGGVDHTTPDFLIKLAHDSIDNGADMFVVHGMHALRGVEIYKDKPVFYNVSNFVFQYGLQLGASYDIMANERHMSIFGGPASQVALLTTSHFEHGKLVEVRLYPADLGGALRPISQMGIPLTPSPQDAQRILRDVQEYSKPYGTVISIEDNVGVIRIAPPAG